MMNIIFTTRIFLPAILIVFSSLVNFGASSCCEKERIATLVDAAIDIISKVKSENISCPEEYDSTCGRPLDCTDLYKRGYNESGVYTIWPISRVSTGKTVQVYCDMTDNGWTVIQRRGNFGRPNNFFDQDWASYKKGFGSVETDFWLGNDNIFAITNQRPYSVRFDLENKRGDKAFARYDNFWIDDEINKYALHISGYSGTAGDSIWRHNNMKFTTKDRNDVSLKGTKCSITNKNGWWFRDCYDSNLNGIYNNDALGVIWHAWTQKMESLPKVEIKVKPKSF